MPNGRWPLVVLEPARVLADHAAPLAAQRLRGRLIFEVELCEVKTLTQWHVRRTVGPGA